MNAWMLIGGLAVLATTLWTLLGAWAILQVRRRRPQRPEAALPVTVLKPLSGASPELSENLRSFFNQRYPSFQLVFGVERSDDPAIAVVEALRRAFPEVHATLVVRSERVAQNPKISNLLKMVERADHDLLLISDSSVWAGPDYLADLVATRQATGAGLVTNVFAGTGETSWGAALENVQLNGFVAAGAALPTLLSDAAVIGKSMFFSLSELESLGGLDRVSDLLAEDFVIGKMFQHAGRPVRLGAFVLRSVNGSVRPGAFLARQLRWSMLRLRLRPLAFVFEPLTSPLAVLPLAYGLLGPGALLWALGLLMLRDLGQWLALRGPAGWLWPVLLSPLRELSMLGVWLITPFVKHVSWRGHRVRLGAGTLVFQTRGGRA